MNELINCPCIPRIKECGCSKTRPESPSVKPPHMCGSCDGRGKILTVSTKEVFLKNVWDACHACNGTGLKIEPVANNKELTAMNEKLKAEIIDLKDIISVYKESNGRLQRTRDMCESELTLVKDRVETLTAENKELTALNESQQIEISNLESAFNVKDRLFSDLCITRNKLNADLKLAYERIEKQQSEINELRQQVEQAKKRGLEAVEVARKFQQEIEFLRDAKDIVATPSAPRSIKSTDANSMLITPNAPVDLLRKVENQRTEIKNLAAALELERKCHQENKKFWRNERDILAKRVDALNKPDEQPFLTACDCPYCTNVAHWVRDEETHGSGLQDFLILRRVTYKCSSCKEQFVKMHPIPSS
jgi:vacuolar-type H+-ATPase subunit I/STV1